MHHLHHLHLHHLHLHLHLHLARVRESILLGGSSLGEHCLVLYSVIGWNRWMLCQCALQCSVQCSV
jgi:hypothetical protein